MSSKRGPSYYASTRAVRDRVLKRIPGTTPLRREAKALVHEGKTLQAMEILLEAGDVTQAHVDAHRRWLDEFVRPEDFV